MRSGYSNRPAIRPAYRWHVAYFPPPPRKGVLSLALRQNVAKTLPQKRIILSAEFLINHSREVFGNLLAVRYQAF